MLKICPFKIIAPMTFSTSTYSLTLAVHPRLTGRYLVFCYVFHILDNTDVMSLVCFDPSFLAPNTEKIKDPKNESGP